MTGLDIETIARVGAGRMLNSIAEGLILAALSGVILRLFRVRSPKTRFALWFLTLVVTVSLPFLSGAGGAVMPASWQEPRWVVASGWAWGLFVAWATIAALLLLRLAVSFWRIEKLRRGCRDLGSGFDDLREAALTQSGLKRRVRFCSSTEVLVPTTIGFFRPTVVLPPWALAELSREELKLVLLHELAHLRRGDDWTNLFQKLVQSLYFFHPALYWIEARLALEREMACDERVVEETSNPHAYARSLVSLAERSLAGRTGIGRAWALAQSALGQMRHASLRMLAILSPVGTYPDPGRRPAVFAIVVLVAVTFFTMPHAPELIGFESPHRIPVASSSRPALAQANASNLMAGNRAEKTLPPHPAPKAIPARAKLRVHHRPALLLAGAPREESVEPEGIVVIEATGFDGSGAIISRVRVWRVKVVDHARQSVGQMIVMQVI